MKRMIRRDGAPAAQTALAGAMLLASLGTSMASVALPTLSRAFSAPVSNVQWVVLAYLITGTVVIVSAGRLGDRLGHRRVMIAGLALFAVASILCAAAPTLGTLIAARAVQGIGGAILMALPISIVRETVAKERVGSAMGLLGTMSAIGTALGPSLGGLLLAGFGWRSAFVLLSGLSVLVLGLALRAIPATPPGRRRTDGTTDWPGLALLAVALTAYALATAGGRVSLAWSSDLHLPVAIAALALFIMVEARSASPLVPVSILRDRVFGVSLTMNLLVSTAMMSTLVVGPFFLAFGLRLNEALVGLVMAVGPVTAALAGVPAGRFADRFGAPRVLLAGLLQMSVGLACLAFLPRVFGAAGYVAALILLTPGFQLFLAANNTVVMLASREEQRGMLSGLLGLSRNLGFMTGASAMATLFAVVAGNGSIAEVPAHRIGDAFATTFLVAAGLTMLALVLACLGRPSRAPEPRSESSPCG
ncbi:MFS transporter [Kaistia sp. 32K]|uniref:MFS transporter n=1 Tax=Kaistia sp. 32K TaxID=2795690 RepID=UPI00191565E9|nr:MFS transporter [Kaistia sp. 32K]BCP51731.1 MFS transporter [Kaistia sp. 32K]